VFDGRYGVVSARVVGEGHLKLRLRADSGELVDVIAFRYLDAAAAAPVHAGDAVELVFRADLDSWGGARRMQLVAEWLRPVP